MNTPEIFLLTTGACMLLGALYYIAEHAWSVRKYHEQLDAMNRVQRTQNGVRFDALQPGMGLSLGATREVIKAVDPRGWCLVDDGKMSIPARHIPYYVADTRPPDLYKPLSPFPPAELPWKEKRWL